MVCANPDLVVMHGAKLALCAGALAQWYEEEGGNVRWHGKPYRSVYDTCLALLGIADRSRILAVGDSLRTDIAGAAGGRDRQPVRLPAGSMPKNSASRERPATNPISAASRRRSPPAGTIRSPSRRTFAGERAGLRAA